MAPYGLLIVRSAEKEIGRVPEPVRGRIVRRILALADDPRPPGCVKLSGDEKYRIRQGDRRVVSTIADSVATVTIVRVAHRSDVQASSRNN